MSQTQTLTTVALYARTSANRHDVDQSIQAQLDAMRDYAERNRMRPVSHFVDTRGSREEFDWMMAQATSDSPPFRTVLVYSFDRLTRSHTEMKTLLEELTDNGLEIIAISNR